MDMGGVLKRGQVFLSVIYRFLTPGTSSLHPSSNPPQSIDFDLSLCQPIPIPSPTLSSPLTSMSESGSISPVLRSESPILPFASRPDHKATMRSTQYSVPSTCPMYSIAGADMPRVDQRALSNSVPAFSTTNVAAASFNNACNGSPSHSVRASSFPIQRTVFESI